jgi:tetratricopeptide (TPR) repeat protein
LTTLVVLLGSAPGVRADESQSKAMEHFREGRKLYQISDYRAALQEFKRAFLFKEDAVFLYNIAQCHRQLGEREEALTFYRRYVAAAPDAQNRAQVERIISELQSPRPAPAPPPVAAPPPPPPAPRSVAAPPPSAPLALETRPRPPAPSAPLIPAQGDRSEPEPTPLYRRWWFWTLLGAAAAGAAGAVLLPRRHAADPLCPMGVKC